jgi:hypothetical protein
MSPLMKEHKANLKKMSKKQLIQQNLYQIEMLAQLEVEKESLANTIQIKNNVIKSKDFKIEEQQRIVLEYKELLTISVENL